MRVLFDTDVLLDVLLEREPHVEAAEKLVALVDNRRIEGLICATAATTLHYVGAKVLGRKAVCEHLHTLLGVFDIAAVDRDVLQRALDANGFTDYEDAVVHEAAHSAGCNALVTRDRAGFLKATMPVFQPIELLAVVAARAPAAPPDPRRTDRRSLRDALGDPEQRVVAGASEQA